PTRPRSADLSPRRRVAAGGRRIPDASVQNTTGGSPGPCRARSSRTCARSRSAEAAARWPAGAGQRVSGHGELLRLSARGADLEAEVNLPELRPGADQSPTLEPPQLREDVTRPGRSVGDRAEDNLPAAILVDGERPPGDRRGTDLPGSAVAPAHVVDPDHDLLGPGGVTKPQVVGGLGIGSGLRVHRLGVI